MEKIEAQAYSVVKTQAAFISRDKLLL